MKTSSAAKPAWRLTRAAAMNCAIINQLATPGLGSLLGRRFVEGTGQLVLALAGFGLIVGWFLQIFSALYQQMQELPAAPVRFPWLGKAGLILFGAAWLWSLVTSISLLRAARRLETPPPL